MGLSCRRYYLDQEDRVTRIKSTTFEALIRDPEIQRMPLLAGQRVRMAELIVEVSGRTVLRILRRVYSCSPSIGTAASISKGSSVNNGRLQASRSTGFLRRREMLLMS